MTIFSLAVLNHEFKFFPGHETIPILHFLLCQFNKLTLSLIILDTFSNLVT